MNKLTSFHQCCFSSGLETKVGALGQLKVKGLIVGPIHVSTADQSEDLNLIELTPSAGSLSDLEALIKAAHKKSAWVFFCFVLHTGVMLSAAI